MLRGNGNATENIRAPPRTWSPTGIRRSIRCYYGMEARGGRDISKVYESRSSEISCETKCMGTFSLIIDTIYDSIEGDNVSIACVQSSIISMLIKSNLILVC